ncbi:MULTISPECIES: RICIN domain-containing protein [unclassified Streptomyces]|uniref:RICIN domain-containing protein n=1 Tax=unclassified Streptomyces TaxID=2593676 RepID=UPI00344E494A
MKLTFVRRWRLLGFSLGAAIAASLLMPVQPAQAAPGLEAFTTGAKLTRIGADKTGLIKSAEAAGVARAEISEVLGGRTGTPGLCHGHGINGVFRPDGFCWDKGDDESGYSDAAGGWMPQGFAGAHAAKPDGRYEGRHLYATSWYFGKYEDGTANEEYSRITIAESTGSKVSYGHLALVEPVEGGFREQPYKSHADGVAWYEDRLFVANGAELQVYDLKHIWRMDDTTSAGTGWVDGQTKTAARYHRWALPLVARYSTYSGAKLDEPVNAFPKNNPRACGPVTGELCLSSVSVDRTAGSDGSGRSLVSSEHSSGPGSRIVHWPLASLGTTTPEVVKARPTAYKSPVFGIQGIATDGSDYYMSGSCPTTWPGYDFYTCIHVAKPGQAPRVLTQAPSMTQGLSWDPYANRLWGVNEALQKNNVGQGYRVVFSLNPDTGGTVDGWGWLTNHNRPRGICATPQGEGTANGTPVTVWSCNGAESQRWAFQDGRLVHKASGKCLTPEGDASNVNGAVLTLWTCNPASTSQKFVVTDSAILNDSDRKAITPKGNSFEDGTWLTLWDMAHVPGPGGGAAELNPIQEWFVKGF